MHSVIFGFGICIIGRYRLFERIMEVFVGLMFVTVVGLALLLGPNVGDLVLGTILPRMPEGSLPFVLAVIGGVGGRSRSSRILTGCASAAGGVHPGSR